MTIAEQILEVAKEGLSAWKTFIATREEAYKRSMDKNQEACIEAGEKYILTNENESLDEKKRAKYLLHYRKRFFHYN